MFGRFNPETKGFEFAPVNFVTPEGGTICNFHLDEEKMRFYGFKPVAVDPQPTTGKDQVAVPRFTDQGDSIRESWEVIEIEEGME